MSRLVDVVSEEVFEHFPFQDGLVGDVGGVVHYLVRHVGLGLLGRGGFHGDDGLVARHGPRPYGGLTGVCMD